MPAFNETHPRAEYEYAGQKVTIPHVYSAGHALTEGEASWLNSRVAGSLGNSFGGYVRKQLDAANAKLKKGEPKLTVADLDLDAQSWFDKTFSGYELGVAARGTGGGNALDRKMTAIGREELSAKVKAKGRKVDDYRKAPAAEGSGFDSKWAELVAAYVEREADRIRPIAEAQLAAIKDVASDADDIDDLLDAA